MPKILICMETIAPGGLGTYTLSLIRHYSGSGWEVGLAATHGPGEYFDDTSKIVAESIDLSKCGTLPTKLKRLTKFTVNFNPDILLLNNCSLAHYMLPFLDSSIKPVAVLHCNAPLFYRAASLFAKRVFRWIAPTQTLEEAFLDYIPAEFHTRIRTISHGIDPSRFLYKEKKNQPKRVVTVGFIAENKGVDLLPNIYEKITLSPNPVEFLIVGDGPSADSLKKKVARCCLPVSFTGHVPHERIPEIFAEADILLLPTRTEGFGLVIAEAMMCGVVPVVSQLPGVTDTIVSDRKSGLLVQIDDVDGFAEAVLTLLSRDDLFMSMSKAARDESTLKFSLDSMTEKYTALFQENDDREVQPVGSLFSWAFEMVRILLVKDPDGSIPLVRCLINFTIRIRNRFSGTQVKESL